MTIKALLLILAFSVTVAGPLHADGLLLSTESDYPGEFLRNRVTNVTVTVHGLIAETVVYQEFINEWDRPTDAVYSFPLPPGARATQLLYNRGDVIFRAVLEVREQAPNPGTGEGGTAALVNAYIGRNGLRLSLQDIAPGAVQKIELHYVSLLDYHQGTGTYRYPLNTSEFVSYPIDHLEFNVDVRTTRPITGFDVPTHEGFQVMRQEDNRLHLRLRKPKAYLASDLTFQYQIENTELGVDFFAANNDTLDAHFALMVRPENLALPAEVLPRRVVFLLNNSSRMVGFKLEQSIQAITEALDQLQPADAFNILLFNSTVSPWQGGLVPATAANIDAAKTFLSSVTGRFGNRMEEALRAALAQFESSDFSNAILVFSDGRSPLDPRQIATENVHRTGIFPIGIGDDLDRARLEMTAVLNHGFVTYVDEDGALKEDMLRVFEQISLPLLRDTEIAFDKPDVKHLIPQVFPTTYAGAAFFVTGRYTTPALTSMSLTGQGIAGEQRLVFPVDFTGDTEVNPFAPLLWAKEAIDELEREIDVYGETPALKDSVIALSLRYNIRSRYTAYVADYDDDSVITATEPEVEELPQTFSFLDSNYPNPFNPSTTIRFFIGDAAVGQTKLLKVYNLLGQLVAVIDVSHLRAGWHEVLFDGYGLPSGLYLVRLQIHNRVANTLRIHLVK